jgi:hypothetical protein
MHDIKNIIITPEILKLIADIDEFKGRWKVTETVAPERLTNLRLGAGGMGEVYRARDARLGRKERTTNSIACSKMLMRCKFELAGPLYKMVAE